ncbi:MAG: hypothetical protein GY810_20595, partial [Aureispira sp.]|nr:hypothetical protein [Aureispira sp.]
MRKLNFLIWVLALCCLTINVDAQCPNNYTIEVHKHPTCSNSDNGTLRADYTTYYAGTTYQWSNGSTNRYAYNLAPGNYSVTATDPSTCTYTNSFYLSASPTGMTANLYSNTCNNAYVAVSSNGQWPYTYQWSSGDVTSSITNPVPGVYSLVLTDADGCVATGSHTILPYSVPTITYTTQNATCGNSDGTVDLTVTGGDGPFTYYWYTGQQTTQDVSNLPVGQHTVRITDNKGCNRYESIIIDGPKVTLAGTNLSCGLTNGSMTATVHNASNPTYLWSNGATSATINNLAAGSYSVTASIGGCQLTSSRYIWDGGSLNYISLTDSLQGSGGCAPDSLMATTWDGSGSYFYLWSTGETSQTIHNIVPGATYSVTLTDAIGGCTGDTSITIGSANLNLTATVTDATCSNSDGAADLTVSGGFGSYTYLWSPGGYTTEDISNVPAGSYTVDVQETGTNCISQLTVLVGAQSVTVNTVDATCGLNNGS